MPLRLPAPVLIVLIALAVAVLVALGVWQLERNAEKTRLVEERNEALAGAPLPAAEATALPPDALDYRLVALDGRWDVERAMVLANRARFSTKGEELVVPLLLGPDGPAVLVNRGWYAEGERERVFAALPSLDARVAEPQGPSDCFQTAAPEEQPCGGAMGLARYVEGIGGRQTPAGTWTQLAPADMAAALPYEVLPWTVIEGPLLGPDTPAPREPLAQGFFPYTSTTPHLEYAATWFGLAAVLVAVSVIRFIVTPRRERRGHAPRTMPPNEGRPIR
ncbi:MAG: SURF1 family protein [Dehalococcoidia bacterium]